jgi:hypothetical protein
MNQELDDYLVKRYPQFLKGRNESPPHSPMRYGFQCRDGWFNLLNMLCESIENHIINVKRNNEFNQTQIDLAKAGKPEKMHDWMRTLYEKGELVTKKVPEISVEEVKEKFGELRFSVKGADDEIRGMIQMAKSMSATICEECGKPGKLGSTDSGWMRVLCKEHSTKSVQKLAMKSIIQALGNGEDMTLEVAKVINENEFIGLQIHDVMRTQPKDKNKPPKYFLAKYIENEIHSFWDAEPVDSQ